MSVRPIFDIAAAVAAGADAPTVWEAALTQAVAARVSDIHGMSQVEGLELAFRLDGQLYNQGTVDHAFARRLISHVKTNAGIDLGEHRRPTEGRIETRAGDRDVDLRVSAVPTVHGQDLVVRIFDRAISLLDLADLGLHAEQLDFMQDAIARPHGLILVSGPTGCGKTTTLYAMLRRLAGRGRKIVTIEDPVEYDLPAVNQTQVNTKIGVTFAGLLTAILRQDPDIIMVGEIRDEETARTAVRAANTGHLVLATAHAIRASRAVETMLSLNVHPYFLAVSLRAVLAQVLVKRICPGCRTALPETAEMVVEAPLRRRLTDPEAACLHAGTGCEQCYGTGYLGRMGLFELFIPGAKTRELILRRRPASDIEAVFAAEGTLTLDQVGKLAALNGQTTMEEVVSILPML